MHSLKSLFVCFLGFFHSIDFSQAKTVFVHTELNTISTGLHPNEGWVMFPRDGDWKTFFHPSLAVSVVTGKGRHPFHFACWTAGEYQ